MLHRFRLPTSGSRLLTSSFRRPSAFRLLVIAVLPLLGSCAARSVELSGPMEILAVLPIERAAAEPQEGALETELEENDLPPDAGFAVTAQVYGWLADQSNFRFVPDVTVSDMLLTPALRNAPDITARAKALGREVDAQGVIFGTVTRFRERIGTGLGVTRAASVAFELALLEVATGKIVWKEQFAQTQEPLSSNLLNFWMFWEAGPQWFTARELAGLGVKRLMGRMESAVGN